MLTELVTYNSVETHHKLKMYGSIYFNLNWIEITKIGGLIYFENRYFESRYNVCTLIFLQKNG